MSSKLYVRALAILTLTAAAWWQFTDRVEWVDLAAFTIVAAVVITLNWSSDRRTSVAQGETARSERNLERSEDRLSLALEAADAGAWDADLASGQMTWTDGLCAIWGIDQASAPLTVDEFLDRIDSRDRAGIRTIVAAATDATFEFEYRFERPDGESRWLLSRGRLLKNVHGANARLIGVSIDVTDRRQAEAAHEELEGSLAKAQRLESVGRLAGGIAHDFNNLLLAIQGYAEFALVASAAGNDPGAEIAEIMHAADSAAGLTSQLLAFSRNQMLHPEVLDLNEVAADVNKLYSRIVREDVTFEIVTSPSPVLVSADRGQLEQVLGNLIVNGRDAMPDGGRLTIKVATSDLTSPHDPELAPGRYAVVAVSDTGVGMDAATVAMIFEPFFTTKGAAGTGLGLATAHGIVKQTGGAMWVYSEPGAGTTFKIYLPLAVAGVAATGKTHARLPHGGAAGHGETVLLVEDQPQVRAVVSEMLQTAGYRTLTASGGEEALGIALEEPIDLLISDVMMAGLKGRELAAELRRDQPQLPVLYISGYTDDLVVRRGLLEPEAAFLEKPFNSADLCSHVSELLGSSLLS